MDEYLRSMIQIKTIYAEWARIEIGMDTCEERGNSLVDSQNRK